MGENQAGNAKAGNNWTWLALACCAFKHAYDFAVLM